MDDVVDVLKRLYKEQYNHPEQTRPKPKPGITGEEPEEIEANNFGEVGGTYSSKRVNKSSNREFEDQDDEDEE